MSTTWIASSSGRATSIAAISTRGTITSRTALSVISKMPWIISRSPSSTTPSSSPTATSIFSSSSERNGPRAAARPAPAPAIRRVASVSSRTRGLSTRVRTATGRTSTRATRSACWSAYDFGPISHSTSTTTESATVDQKAAGWPNDCTASRVAQVEATITATVLVTRIAPR